MTDIDLDALEATARAATSGPWMLDAMGEDEPEINYWAHLFIGTANPNVSGSHEVIATSEDRHGPNAQHIAAFDPPTALALIARLREAEELIAKIDDLTTRHYLDTSAGRAIYEITGAYYKTTKTERSDR